MTTTTINKVKCRKKQHFETEKKQNFSDLIKESWKLIPPSWPLKNLIAVNPLQGFEHLAIEDALLSSALFFQQKDFPKPLESVHRETIKWLQAYFDEGQATIEMPLREEGLYRSWKQTALYDSYLHNNEREKIEWFGSLSDSPEEALAHCLLLLKIPKEKTERFLKLLLTSIPGWASYIKYRTEWAGVNDKYRYPVTQIEFLAMLSIITYLLWPEAREFLIWNQDVIDNIKPCKSPLIEIEKHEKLYRSQLLNKLMSHKVDKRKMPSAQIVFCIDVRSEPMRRAIESIGEYETFGCAGFFGVPITINDRLNAQSYASCPVLISPQHVVTQLPTCSKFEERKNRNGYERITFLKTLYQSLKYSFSTPFALVEGLGLASGVWLGLRTFFPNFSCKLKKAITNLIRKPIEMSPSLDDITFEDQCTYAEGALKVMGLTHFFSPLVVFCGHGSSTQNNPYATALDCGACGGHHGSTNARVLAAILNLSEVRKHLWKQGIKIPKETLFIGAEHNTTTDEMTLYTSEFSDPVMKLIQDLKKAEEINSSARICKMKDMQTHSLEKNQRLRCSQDWAQVRPEWGLARNAAFIIGPRSLTKSIDLDGRCFLHSYDQSQDDDGKSLEAILTAPMVVAHWINSQYLFSTLDNVSYGGGSKVTNNITGKIGVMQGNASDLMTGLSLQSVYSNDVDRYHEPQRLMTVVYASRRRIDRIIDVQPILKKLFGNGWVQIVSIEHESEKPYFLQRDLTWKKML